MAAAFTAYIPSYNDSDAVAESLATMPDWDVVISDNASDERHAAMLTSLSEDHQCTLCRHYKSLGRIGNWSWCIKDFLNNTRYAEHRNCWLKFVMAGNTMLPGSLAAFQDAAEKYPDARLLVGQVENVYAAGLAVGHPEAYSEVWRVSDQLATLAPAETMKALVLGGNPFHSLTAVAFRADSLAEHVAVCPDPFCGNVMSITAEHSLFIPIARKYPTVYIPQPVCQFIFERRRYSLAKTYSLEHYLEEGLMRLRAADAFLELTDDRNTHLGLLGHIAGWVRKGLSQSADTLAR